MTFSPLVSVIMPSFNQLEFIGPSIASVMSQDHDQIELIVQDGGSTDGTVEMLADIAAGEPRLKWRSQDDAGPANALNKALSQVRGTIIGWLNSDDLYAPGAVSSAVERLVQDDDLIMVYGHGEHVDAESRPIGRYPTRTPDVGLSAFANGCFICQPTVFFKSSMRALLGELDEGLATTFDYEYWMRAFAAFPERIGFVDRLMAQSRLHDACITRLQRRKVALEGVELCARHLGRSETHWLTTYFEEMLSLPEADRGFADFGAHCQDVLNEAAPFLSAEDMDKMRASIA